MVLYFEDIKFLRKNYFWTFLNFLPKFSYSYNHSNPPDYTFDIHINYFVEYYCYFLFQIAFYKERIKRGKALKSKMWPVNTIVKSVLDRNHEMILWSPWLFCQWGLVGTNIKWWVSSKNSFCWNNKITETEEHWRIHQQPVLTSLPDVSPTISQPISQSPL